MEAVARPSPTPPPTRAMPMEMRFHVDRYDTTIMEAPPVTMLMMVNWSDLNAHVNRVFPRLQSSTVRSIRLVSIVARPSIAAEADRMPSVSLLRGPVTLFDNSGLSLDERNEFGIVCQRQDASQPRTKLVLALTGHAAYSTTPYDDAGAAKPTEMDDTAEAHYRALFGSRADMFRRLPSRAFWHDRFAASQNMVDSDNIDEIQSVMGVGWSNSARSMRRISERNARIPIYDYAVAHQVGIIPMSEAAKRVRKIQKSAPLDQELINEHLFPHLVHPYNTQRATGAANPPDIQSPFALLAPQGPVKELTYQWPLMQRVKAIVTDLFPSHRTYVDPDLLSRAYEQVAAMEIKARYPVWQTRLEIDLEDTHDHVLSVAFETDFRKQSPLLMYTGDMASQRFIEMYANGGPGIGRIRYSTDKDLNTSGRGKTERVRMDALLDPSVYINELTNELVDALDYDAFSKTIEAGLPPWYREAVSLYYTPPMSCKFPPDVERFIEARIAGRSSKDDASLEMMLETAMATMVESVIDWTPDDAGDADNGNNGTLSRKRRASQSPPSSPGDEVGASSDRPRAYVTSQANKRRRVDEVTTPAKGSSIGSVWERITRSPPPSAVPDVDTRPGFESQWDVGLSLRTSQVMNAVIDTKSEDSGLGDSLIDLALSNGLPSLSDLRLDLDFQNPFTLFDDFPLLDGFGGGNGSDGNDDETGPLLESATTFAAPSPGLVERDDAGNNGGSDDNVDVARDRERIPYLSPVSSSELDEDSRPYNAEQHRTFTAMVTLFATQAQWSVDENRRLNIRGPYHYLTANASPDLYTVPWPLRAIERLAHANADWPDATVEFLLAPALSMPHKDWLRVRNVSAVRAMRAAYSPFSVHADLPPRIRGIEAVFVNVRDNKTHQLFFPGRGVPILAAAHQDMASTHLRLVVRICDEIMRARITKTIPGRWNVVQPLWFGRRLPLFAWAVNADGTKVVFAQTRAVDMNSAVVRSGVMIAGALVITANLVHAIQVALHARNLPLVEVDDNYGSVALATADVPHVVFAALEGPLVADPPLVIFNPVPSDQQNRSRKIPSRF